MNAAGIDQMPESKRPREDSEPMDEEGQNNHDGHAPLYRTRAVPSTRRGRAGGPTKNFKSVINLLHAQISQHRSGNIFHNPIKKSEAPDYYDIVKRPMDLKTVKAKIKDNSITNSQEFQRDIYLMFVNAMMYNRPRSDIFKMAEEVGVLLGEQYRFDNLLCRCSGIAR
jgi:bromodomain-containing protein 8